MAANDDAATTQPDDGQAPHMSPLGEAEALIAAWIADNRYYFSDTLHANARADLATRIAKALETALKQAEAGAAKPSRKGPKGEKA